MSKSEKVTPRGIDTNQAAEYLGVSAIALRQGRSEGARDGRMPPPPYVRLGRKVVYLVDELDKYLELHRICP